MRYRTLGRTGLEVSELGFGAWEIGWTDPAEGDAVGRLLNRALDLGINFIDSSAAYRWSEELIAKYTGHRRDEFFFDQMRLVAGATARRGVGADPRLLGSGHRTPDRSISAKAADGLHRHHAAALAFI